MTSYQKYSGNISWLGGGAWFRAEKDLRVIQVASPCFNIWGNQDPEKSGSLHYDNASKSGSSDSKSTSIYRQTVNPKGREKIFNGF